MDNNTPLDLSGCESLFANVPDEVTWTFQPLQQAQDQYNWDSGQLCMPDWFPSADDFNSTNAEIHDHYSLIHDQVNINGDLVSGANGALPRDIDSGKDAQICYGAITDVKALVQNVIFKTVTERACFNFGVSRYGNSYGLWSNGSLVAILDKKTCGIMQGVAYDIDCDIIRIEAFNDIAQWSTSIFSGSKSITLDLNQPQFGLQGFAYYNPHFLHVAEIRGEDVYETPLPNIRPGESHTSLSEQDASRVQTTTIEAQKEVDSILDSLSHHEILMERNTDRRMKTKLLDHQKQALDFILRMETGDLPAELTMWRETEDDDGDIIYQHLVTGSRRPQLAEAKGGILADEMGLGKSIVSLSVIAASFDRALEFGERTDADGNVTSNRRRSKATLIIVPSLLLVASWIDETRKHMQPASLRVWRYHGAGRQNEKDQLHSNDVVLTTYATVAMESSGSKQVLRNIDWFRIVLDEAHDIRNRTTKRFQIIASLSAQHRWCLTGTPIQNSLEDLGSLVAFLRVPVLEDAAAFRKFIVNQSYSRSSDRFKHLRLLLQSICLRRTREVIGLTDAVPELRFISLSPEERNEYDHIVYSCRNNIERVVNRCGKNINSTVLESLLRLRLFCNNGVPKTNWSTDASSHDEILSYLQQVNQAVCAYCEKTVYSIDSASDADGGTLMSKCYHLACRECLPQHYNDRKRCPRCHDKGADPDLIETIRKLREINASTENGLHNLECPSKLTALMEDLSSSSQRKSIVFSSWKTTIDLVGRFLAHRGLQHVYIHGSVPLQQRKEVLDDFRSSEGPNILLMTLGTGAVGLNLAVASRIYLLEPQWNPSVGLQAMSRALRLGQKEKVTIIRYIVRNSVEDSNILSRQTNKLREARGGFEKHTRGAPSDRMQECLNLFSISEEDPDQAN